MIDARLVATSLLFCFCITILFLCILAWRKRSSAGASAVYLSLSAICAAIYNLGYALEINSLSESALFFWVRFQHLGIQFILPFWLLFSLHITGRARKLKLWTVGLIFLVPVIGFAASQTLGGHNILHPNARLMEGIGFSSFVYDRSWLLYLIVAVQSLYLTISLAVFVVALVRGNPFPRIQAIIYIAGSILPWTTSILYNFAILPYNIDLSPFAMGLSIALFVAGFLRIGILDISPLARDLIFEGMQDGVLVMDTQGQLMDMNHSMSSVLPNFHGKETADKARILKDSPPELKQFLEKSGSGEMEYQGQGAKDSPIFHVTATPLRDRFGKDLGKLINFHDVSEMKELQRKLEFMATHDVLTGLHNRRYLNEVLEMEIERALSEGSNLSLVMLDLDHFKLVNDVYGHEAGDKVLEAVGAICRHQAGESNKVGRFGGEEFLMILPGASLDQAFEAAERTRKSIDGLRLHYEGKEIRITSSFGVACLKPGNDTLKDLLIAADTALYKAKASGRNKTSML